MYVRPKKHLGQHFLKNDGICADIASAVTFHNNYRVFIEVGPGTGALTKHLLQHPEKEMFVSEVDNESVAYLTLYFPELKGHIIEKDFLQLPLNEVFQEPIGVVGNFPYNISSQILFKVLEHRDQVREVVGMFQKEVAMRIASGPGSRDYGILSVLLQAFYDIEYLFTVEAIEFDPPPKVKSGVIRLIRKENTSIGCDEKLFKQVIKTAFNQRRKTLRNSLKAMPHLGMDFSDELYNKRPEQLSVDQFIDLTNRFEAHGLQK